MEARKQKHIMAIGAHIGDAELTTGKTLATHSLMGDRITTVALTAGERGAPPDRDIDEFRRYNIDCATGFAKALGGKFICVGYPDGEVPDNDEARLKVCDIIRAEKPDVILTHWHQGLHIDHRRTALIVDDARYYAALRGFERKDPPHSCAGPYYAENWEDAPGFEPYIYVDVTAGYDLWYEEIQKLWLTNNSPWFKYKQYYDGLSASRGALVHKARAECFAVDHYSKRVVKDSF